MRTGEREARLGVIESCGLPSRGVVTGIAGLREAAGNVVGIRGSLEILKVTGNAGGRGQVVIVVDVTVGASPGRNRVRAREREVDTAVVEVGRSPACSRVAGFPGLPQPPVNPVLLRDSFAYLSLLRTT